MHRSPLLHGFRLTVRRFQPLLWVYVFNAAIAWLASMALRTQFSSITHDSLAAQRMISGFDLGVVIDATRQIGDAPHGAATGATLSFPLFALVYLLLVPGTLFAYQTDTAVSFSRLLQLGVASFWSFVRIVLLTALLGGPVIGIAMFAQNLWSKHLDEHVLGKPGWELQTAGAFIVFLVVCFVRLYFDFVEVHTVALAQTTRHNDKPDRRVRKTLRPAWRVFRARFAITYLSFVALAVLGAVAVYVLGLSALHHLGQPRSWPTLLLAQLGLFLMLFTRFWQRSMETVLFQNISTPLPGTPIFAPPVERPIEHPFVTDEPALPPQDFTDPHVA